LLAQPPNVLANASSSAARPERSELRPASRKVIDAPLMIDTSDSVKIH
jgi:hypothetical protein